MKNFEMWRFTTCLVELFVILDTGSVAPKAGTGRPRVRNEANIETVRAVTEDQSCTSIRHLHYEVDLSYDLNNLQQRIVNNLEEINNTPWMLSNVFNGVKRRLGCVEM
ncbi:hypothetical protein BDFB_005598, partial [Asbolus verrucosus]